MEEIENGFRITTDTDQTVEATYDQAPGQVSLEIDDKKVILSFGETGYFLAFMSGWYELGGD